MKLKTESMKTSQENEKYCAELESYVQLYNQKSSSLSQGLSFYTEFSVRINDMYQKTNDFVIAREIEKNDLINRINGGGLNSDHNDKKDVFNDFNLYTPNNVITNMDYQYQYNYMPNNNLYNNPNKGPTQQGQNYNPNNQGYYPNQNNNFNQKK